MLQQIFCLKLQTVSYKRPKSSQMIKHSVFFVCCKHLVSWKQICSWREDDDSPKKVQECLQLVSSISISEGKSSSPPFPCVWQSLLGAMDPVKFGDWQGPWKTYAADSQQMIIVHFLASTMLCFANIFFSWAPVNGAKKKISKALERSLEFS